MSLHSKVNDLLGFHAMDFHESQYAVCEVRTFVYGTRPRKTETTDSWLEEMRAAHRDWHRQVRLPHVWGAVAARDRKRAA